MLIVIIRTAMLYVIIIAAVRFMGKRQISDLQTTELVVTMLLSDIASLSIQNTSEPLLGGIIPMTVLVVMEVLLSGAMIAIAPLRRLICGSPIIVINNGKIDQKELKRLRMTVEELTEELRQQDVFSVGDVMFGIVETNGKLSVLKKPEKENPTLDDIGIKTDESNIESAVICDGQLCRPALTVCGKNADDIGRILQSKDLDIKEVFLMTISRSGKYTIVEKS
ncbi:MAG: DUF421 domain-containing protein [Clostridia bacterium]|nr:DUF421 domain-containing protein [Clostridia bacterium]